MQHKDQYLESVRTVLMGGSTLKLDTNALDIPKAENITE